MAQEGGQCRKQRNIEVYEDELRKYMLKKALDFQSLEQNLNFEFQKYLSC